jgi:hypothetical protein
MRSVDEAGVISFSGLSFVLETRDGHLAEEVSRVAVARRYRTVRLEALRDLGGVLPARGSSVLMLDLDCSAGRGVRAARAVASMYPRLPIVIVADDPRVRSIDGFRLVDRWAAGERIVDALELAHIGIPASTADSLVPLTR